MRVPWWMTLLAALVFAGLLAVLTALWLHYDDLPDPYPAHYGINGEADRLRPKSPAAVFGPGAMGLVASALLFFNVWAMTLSPALSPGQQRVGMYMTAMIATFAGTLVTLASAAPLGESATLPGAPWSMILTGGGILVTAIGGIVLWKRQPSAERYEGQSLLVERASGLGTTVNWSHPLAWVYPTALVLVGACTAWLLLG